MTERQRLEVGPPHMAISEGMKIRVPGEGDTGPADQVTVGTEPLPGFLCRFPGHLYGSWCTATHNEYDQGGDKDTRTDSRRSCSSHGAQRSHVLLRFPLPASHQSVESVFMASRASLRAESVDSLS